MKRRKFVLGSTAALSGIGLVVGARGFTETRGRREMRIAVENDEDAYLGLVPEVEFGDVLDVKCGGDTSIDIRNQTNVDPIEVSVDPNVVGDAVTLEDASVRESTIGVGERETVTFEPGCQPGTDGANATLNFHITARGDGSDGTLIEVDREVRVNCSCPKQTATAAGTSSSG